MQAIIHLTATVNVPSRDSVLNVYLRDYEIRLYCQENVNKVRIYGDNIKASLEFPDEKTVKNIYTREIENDLDEIFSN